MDSNSALQVSLEDPLSEVTRGERRMLLGVSVLSIFIAKTGLVPTKISALGVDLEKAEQQAFLVVLALVVLYFVAAFVLYGLTDWLAWRISYNEGAIAAHKALVARVERSVRAADEDPVNYIPSHLAGRWTKCLTLPASYFRALFEFLLPVLVGGYAIYALILAVLHHAPY